MAVLAMATAMVMVVAVVSIDHQPSRWVSRGSARVLSIPRVPPMRLVTAFVTSRLPTMLRTAPREQAERLPCHRGRFSNHRSMVRSLK